MGAAMEVIGAAMVVTGELIIVDVPKLPYPLVNGAL